MKLSSFHQKPFPPKPPLTWSEAQGVPWWQILIIFFTLLKSHILPIKVSNTWPFVNTKCTIHKTLKTLLTFFFEAALLTLLELRPAPGDSFQLKKYNVLDCPMSINELCQFTQCLVPTKMYWQRSPKERRTSRIAKHWPPLIRFRLACESCIPSPNHR